MATATQPQPPAREGRRRAGNHDRAPDPPLPAPPVAPARPRPRRTDVLFSFYYMVIGALQREPNPDLSGRSLTRPT